MIHSLFRLSGPRLRNAGNFLVNIVDVPAYCSFIIPSVLRRDQLTIAVSTEGASPGLAKRIRHSLEEYFSPAYGPYLRLAALARTYLRKKGVSYERRDDFFSDFFVSDVLAQLVRGNIEQAAVITAALLHHYDIDVPASVLKAVLKQETPMYRGASEARNVSTMEHKPSSCGRVYLVGAGPGDPDLITLKGLRCLRMADVLVYDRLVNLSLLDEAPSGAERVFVGKKPGCHSVKQEEIHVLLIHYARQGRLVVRLKGGDPLIFGRGGEEALALAHAGIAFEVVPGVSSAIAVPAYAGIPVTHRNYASSVTIVTGHGCAYGRHPFESHPQASLSPPIHRGPTVDPDVSRGERSEEVHASADVNWETLAKVGRWGERWSF